MRRIPLSLRGKVEYKNNELIKMDIIEPVEGPKPWASPVVVVPKANGEIRLCVDMRRATCDVQMRPSSWRGTRYQQLMKCCTT